jgi:hypothetical protein
MHRRLPQVLRLSSFPIWRSFADFDFPFCCEASKFVSHVAPRSFVCYGACELSTFGRGKQWQLQMLLHLLPSCSGLSVLFLFLTSTASLIESMSYLSAATEYLDSADARRVRGRPGRFTCAFLPIVGYLSDLVLDAEVVFFTKFSQVVGDLDAPVLPVLVSCICAQAAKLRP